MPNFHLVKKTTWSCWNQCSHLDLNSFWTEITRSFVLTLHQPLHFCVIQQNYSWFPFMWKSKLVLKIDAVFFFFSLSPLPVNHLTYILINIRKKYSPHSYSANTLQNLNIQPRLLCFSLQKIYQRREIHKTAHSQGHYTNIKCLFTYF